MIITRISTVTDELVSAFERLIPQSFVSAAKSGDRHWFLRILRFYWSSVSGQVKSPSQAFGVIVYRVPTGIRAYIEM
jgi:hypothetical protein